jgi:hypothetical protein
MMWPDGQGDDYSRYMLVDGVRHGMRGFAVTGTQGQGLPILVVGAGTRLHWVPFKAAFRAGYVPDGRWDFSNIGIGSVAMGLSTKASGNTSTAFGGLTEATGEGSFAAGTSSKASGENSLAIGNSNTASGSASVALGSNNNAYGHTAVALGWANGADLNSVAIGTSNIASGRYSTAVGHDANTNNKNGAFVYADDSEQGSVKATVNQQFVVRAQNIWFGKNNNVTATAGRFIETSTGAYLSTGGTWSNSSDVNRKHLFQSVDAEDVLAKVAALPIRTWSYKDDAPTVRHMGPTAQDFAKAFGLGETDKAIATVDADGVSLAAIRALVHRTRELEAKLEAKLDALAAELAQLRAQP